MRYLLLIASEESIDAARTPEEEAALMQDYGVFSQECQEAGALLGGERLRPTDRATTVRLRDGETLVTDGPFAETKEQIAGYYLVDCADLDEALKWAKQCPMLEGGSVEVRPLMILPE